MSSESTIFNNDEILLPPKNNKKKTLVLDLDETLVHSQFMTFSDPSDVVIQIEL
jgi:TFIIF-interacting CTD phosphatase-like protein